MRAEIQYDHQRLAPQRKNYAKGPNACTGAVGAGKSNGESEVDVNRKQSHRKDRSATIQIVSASFEPDTTLLEAVPWVPQTRSTSLRGEGSEDNTPLQKLHD